MRAFLISFFFSQTVGAQSPISKMLAFQFWKVPLVKQHKEVLPMLAEPRKGVVRLLLLWGSLWVGKW